MSIITGTTLADNLIGTAVADLLIGYTGDDRIIGNGGDDTIWGNDGDDLLNGGQGTDVINGGDGFDQIFAGPGGDRISGGLRNDELHGEDGEDILIGNAGDDMLFGGAGADVIDGGAGTDFLSYLGEQGVEVYLEAGAGVVYTSTGQDRVSNVEGIYGSFFDDILGSSDTSVTSWGLSGDDFLGGSSAPDKLYGGDGSDAIHGDQGNDFLSGGNGDDQLIGGLGNDRIATGSGNDVVLVIDGQIGGGDDTVLDYNQLTDKLLIEGETSDGRYLPSGDIAAILDSDHSGRVDADDAAVSWVQVTGIGSLRLDLAGPIFGFTSGSDTVTLIGITSLSYTNFV